MAGSALGGANVLSMSYEKLKNSELGAADAEKASEGSTGFPLLAVNRLPEFSPGPVPMLKRSHPPSVSNAKNSTRSGARSALLREKVHE